MDILRIVSLYGIPQQSELCTAGYPNDVLMLLWEIFLFSNYDFLLYERPFGYKQSFLQWIKNGFV